METRLTTKRAKKAAQRLNFDSNIIVYAINYAGSIRILQNT